MHRIGLDYFATTPRSGDTVSMIFMRFDEMLSNANGAAEFNISYRFRTCMLLALLRMSPRWWTEHPKEMNHRFPRTADEYRALQQLIIREATLTEHICNFGHAWARFQTLRWSLEFLHWRITGGIPTSLHVPRSTS